LRLGKIDATIIDRSSPIQQPPPPRLTEHISKSRKTSDRISGRDIARFNMPSNIHRRPRRQPIFQNRPQGPARELQAVAAFFQISPFARQFRQAEFADSFCRLLAQCKAKDS